MLKDKFLVMVNAWFVGVNVVDAWEHGYHVFAAALLTIPIK